MRVRRGSAPNPAGDLDRLVQGRQSSSSDSIRARSYVHPTCPPQFDWLLSPMRLLVIGPREFQTMMLTLPSVAEHVAQTAAERE